VTPDERRSALESVAAEIRGVRLAGCTRRERSAVRAEGSAETEVSSSGEGPGFNEDRQGRPSSARAGAFLTELLGSVGWGRSDVFITKRREVPPPENRDPEPEEVAACAAFLRRQLAVIEPALVVTLGRHSLGSFLPGARDRPGATGPPRPASTDLLPPEATVFAMYHPAAALHQGSLRQTLITDMGGAPRALLAARERAAAIAGRPANGRARCARDPRGRRGPRRLPTSRRPRGTWLRRGRRAGRRPADPLA